MVLTVVAVTDKARVGQSSAAVTKPLKSAFDVSFESGLLRFSPLRQDFALNQKLPARQAFLLRYQAGPLSRA